MKKQENKITKISDSIIKVDCPDGTFYKIESSYNKMQLGISIFEPENKIVTHIYVNTDDKFLISHRFCNKVLKNINTAQMIESTIAETEFSKILIKYKK